MPYGLQLASFLHQPFDDANYPTNQAAKHCATPDTPFANPWNWGFFGGVSEAVCFFGKVNAAVWAVITCTDMVGDFLVTLRAILVLHQFHLLHVLDLLIHLRFHIGVQRLRESNSSYDD